MAKQAVKKVSEQNLIINKIDIRQIDRQSQDITKWRSAIQSAESVFNPTRRALYDLYHDILLDGTLSSAIEKRQNAIINRPFSFMQDGEDIDEICKLTQNDEWDEMIREILNSKFWGYTLLELQFHPDKIISDLIDRRHVKPELKVVARTPYETTGIRYLEPPYDRFTITVGKDNNLGILMKVAQYVIYKRGNFGDWAEFAEIFGMPFRKGTYEPFDESSRLELTKALDEAGSAAYIVVPKGTDVEFITNSSGNANGDLYDKLRKACNDEINVCVLGQTLTTNQGDKGARSLGEVHQDVMDEIHESDKQFVVNVLNSKLVPLLKLHGYPVGTGKFIIPTTEIINKKDRLDMDIKIAEKVPVADDYFYETYNIPKPDNYDQLKAEAKEKSEQISGTSSRFGGNEGGKKAGQETGDDDKPGALKNLFNELKYFFR